MALILHSVADIDSGITPLSLMELLHPSQSSWVVPRTRPPGTTEEFAILDILTLFRNFFSFYSLNELAELMKCDILLNTLAGNN